MVEIDGISSLKEKGPLEVQVRHSGRYRVNKSIYIITYQNLDSTASHWKD